jgi:microcin C transport system substrate-binding protein
LPDAQQLALLEPWRGQIPQAAFGAMALAPRTDGENSLRGNLRQAQALLKDAGWEYRDGALRNAKNQVLELELLDSNEGSTRVVSPWARNLEKIGVKLNFRAADFSLYQQRLQKFEFDITSLAYGGTNNPGQEFADLFGSKAASQEDSGNYSGIKSPAVDALVAHMVGAKSKAELLPACRALDRVITHSHILIPQWSSTTHRMVFNAWRLAKPDTVPPYSPGESWAIETWWAR